MVFFTCNHCGESLKKQAVEKHGWRCKRELNVSCMDCQKDFVGQEYDAHTSCITEAEKYSGKDYVPKANANKGAKKQEAWLDTIRAITNNSKGNLSKGITEVFNVIRKNDNIPRKQKGFMNFFSNSAKHIRRNDVEAAWALLEEEVKKNQSKAAEQKQANGAVPDGMWIPGQKGTLKEDKKVKEDKQQNGFKKRKLEEESDVAAEAEVPVKKKSKKQSKKEHQNGVDEDHEQLVENDATTNGISADAASAEKFQWGEVIRSTLMSKNNEMKLDKLKKKVLKKYRQLVGADQISDKIERKFSKKLSKLSVEVDNDTVRLLA